MTNRNSKRYYWLKLNENFFEREEIRIIEDMKNGKDYIIFYMKLLLKSVGTEGVLKFRGVIPYTSEMLSSITNTDVDTVKVAIKMFTELGLMDLWDDGTLFMAETQNMIGSETGWAKKKRKQRDKGDNVPLNKDNVPSLSPTCPTEIDIELELELDKEIEEEESSDSNFKELVQAFEQNGFGTISSYVTEALVDLSDEYTSSWVLDAIKLAVDRNARNLKYVEGILKSWQAKGKDDSTSRFKEKSTNSWKVDAT